MTLLLFVAIFAKVIAPYDPNQQTLSHRNRPPGWVALDGRAYVLGSDPVGRDVLTRVIYGARISIIVAISAVFISGMIGTVLGMASGFYAGRLDSIVMRLADMQLAMPAILFAIAWAAFIGPGLVSVVVVIATWSWVQYARTARAMVLSLRERDFVEAARAIGGSTWHILLIHIAPNLVGPIIVLATVELGRAVLLEATLSFLGVGVQPPTPTWGGMISDGRNYVDSAWWLTTFPGLAVVFFVLAANLSGDVLRDVLDPRTR